MTTNNVDKGVCTNDVLEDLHRAIKFEAVFSTLIENKILSIKRECEEKRKEKQSRSALARFLFRRGRRNVGSIVVDPNIEAFPVESINGVGDRPPDERYHHYLLHHRQHAASAPVSGQWCIVAQENEKNQLDSEREFDDDPMGRRPRDEGRVTETCIEKENRTAITSSCVAECASLDRGCFGGRRPELEHKYDVISIQSDTYRGGGRTGLSNDIVYTAKQHRPNTTMVKASGSTSPVSVATAGPATQNHHLHQHHQHQHLRHSGKRSQSDDFIARSNNLSGQIPFSRPDEKPATEICPRRQLMRKYGDGEDRSPSGQPSTTTMGQPPKSILTSSSSSLQSTLNNSSSQPRTITAASNSNKIGPSESTDGKVGETAAAASKVSPREASVLLEQERKRLRVFEMRSISAQCSPIMPRHIEFDSVVSLSNSAPISLHPVNNDECNPEDGPNSATNNSVRGALDATPVKTHRRPNHKSKSQRAAEYLASQIDFDSLASYPLVNPMTQGIISSFNQLKSPNMPRVVPMKQQQAEPKARKGGSNSNEHSLINSTASTRRSGGAGEFSHSTTATTCCTTGGTPAQIVGGKARKSGRGSDRLMGGQLSKGRDDDNNEPIRQSIICDRNLDTIEFYPSSATSGKCQCILSRPPNEPIEIEYCDEFLYDTSVHLSNSEELRGQGGARNLSEIRDGRFDSIMDGGGGGVTKSHQRHHHRHRHRHKHKHHQGKKKKRKILVHDLDDQSIKVIDPDDMPQRARWTIIATACLLLVMCLALVGATLRMAPLIDDMVRQESERQQENLNRFKFGRNYSESQFLAAAQEDVP